MRPVAAALLAFLLLEPVTVGAQEAQPPPPERPSGWADKPVVRASRAMVVSANPLATEAGLAVLDEGGSAADAAVAVQLVLNLAEPQSSGIGGGAFMLHWDAKARLLTTLDGRETAPAAAGPGYFLRPDGTPIPFDEARNGGRAVGVPGTLALIAAAHERHGRLAPGRLLEPAIKLAEGGFPISPRLAGAIAADAELLKPFAATAAYFLEPDGRPKAVGTILRNPDFAATLRRVAEEGPAAFYAGPIGRDVVRAVREAPASPGLMTEADLAAYRVKEREPVCASYRGARTVCGMGPPSSGGVAVAEILGLLEHFDMTGLGPTVDGAQALLEASKLAFADRDLYLGDPDFVRLPLPGLLDPAYLTARAQGIRLDASMPKATAGNPPWRERAPRGAGVQPDEHGTTHFVVVDPEGDVVSMTTTIELGFGSRIMVDGFLLNNEMTDFSFRPAGDGGRPVANRVEGGKRPRSSMAPTIVFDRAGVPELAIGSPGGSQIIGYVAQGLVAILDWGMSPQDAVAMGHVLSRNGPAELEVGTPVVAWAPALAVRGQAIKLGELNSGLHAVLLRGGALESGVDPRREGMAAGR